MSELAALLLCGVAAFAQWRIANFTATPGRRWLTRAVLLTLGVAVGLVCMRDLPSDGSPIVPFLLGFGVVHVPAALVLLLKQLRGEQPS